MYYDFELCNISYDDEMVNTDLHRIIEIGGTFPLAQEQSCTGDDYKLLGQFSFPPQISVNSYSRMSTFLQNISAGVSKHISTKGYNIFDLRPQLISSMDTSKDWQQNSQVL